MIPANGKAVATAGAVSDGQNEKRLEGPTNTKSPFDPAIILGVLAELFPDAFVAERWKAHKPLKIGIRQDLIDRGVLRPTECKALHWYVQRRMYQAALAAGGHRHDLDGTPCGEVSPEDAAGAKASLAAIDVRAAELATKARAEHRAAQKPLSEPKGPRPYHTASPQKVSVRPPQPASQPRRDGLGALRAAAQARKAAQATEVGQ